MSTVVISAFRCDHNHLRWKVSKKALLVEECRPILVIFSGDHLGYDPHKIYTNAGIKPYLRQRSTKYSIDKREDNCSADISSLVCSLGVILSDVMHYFNNALCYACLSVHVSK